MHRHVFLLAKHLMTRTAGRAWGLAAWACCSSEHLLESVSQSVLVCCRLKAEPSAAGRCGWPPRITPQQQAAAAGADGQQPGGSRRRWQQRHELRQPAAGPPAAGPAAQPAAAAAVAGPGHQEAGRQQQDAGRRTPTDLAAAAGAAHQVRHPAWRLIRAGDVPADAV